MALKVAFEIGHTSKLKSKKTPEGFTHDWELYVKGVDKNDISHFVDKVVYTLHDSFPKPKRTYKEAPYVLKESGYAGFVLPIDIYFKNRDEPKRVTFQYDLDLQNTGPPVHRSIIKKFVFNTPSEEFRQKLLKGGANPIMANYDEKSRDSMDERSQSSKSKITIEMLKKHNKIRPDDSKMQTFANLFGTPITKTTTKVSPEPKNKGSPSMTSVNIIKTSNKSNDKTLNVPVGTLIGKDKSEKIERKDKHRRSSPHKEREFPKEARKMPNEEKHDRREDKPKEKSHSKDRDRSKDRNLKRPISPKRGISPKANRGDEFAPKLQQQQLKTEPDGKKSSSSSGKKAKKEKKSHEKDKERERKEREREKKDKEDRLIVTNPPVTSMNASNSSNNSQIKINTELKVETKKDNVMTRDLKKMENKILESSATDKKMIEKHDKDLEKKHKHKKRDKAKDKEKEPSLKEKKKDKISKQKEDSKKVLQSPQLDDVIISDTKNNSCTTSNQLNKFSDHDSSDSESRSPALPVVEPKTNINSESSNSSFPDLVQPIKKLVPPPEPKSDKKEHKVREKTKPEKDVKKRKRKTKEDSDNIPQKTISPVTPQSEPPNKQSKKEEYKTDEKPISPNLPNIGVSQLKPQNASPRNTGVFRAPSAAPLQIPITNNNSNDRNISNIDYMTELKELQRKIMTLQDNNELQQVVEMIAATGRFEVTSKTFDFDLCALDRTTVQRLQDFFATSVS